MVDKLDDEAVDKMLIDLEGWRRAEGRSAIQKSFVFKNFAMAWHFMCRIAKHAEEVDHHPEWSNVYNKVDITLTTHDAGGVSQRDIDMAREIESYV